MTFDIAGVFGVANLLAVLAAIFIITGVGGLVLYYLGPLLCAIPIVFELFCYSACGLIVYAGHVAPLRPMVGTLVILLGLLGLAPSLLLSLGLHSRGGGSVQDAVHAVSLVCALVWAVEAYTVQSELIGMFSLMALFGYLGFSVATIPMGYAVGFDSTDVIPRCMNAALYFIVAAVATAHREFDQTPYVRPFHRSAQLIATFVYFVGCLIISNRYYSMAITYTEKSELQCYVLCNVLSFASGIAALFFGSTIPSLTYLRGMSGTFFVLMVFNKYTEIPWGSVGYAWGAIGFGGLLYGMVLLMNQYPDFIRFSKTTVVAD